MIITFAVTIHVGLGVFIIRLRQNYLFVVVTVYCCSEAGIAK